MAATAVGGIPEQVKSLERGAWNQEHSAYNPKEATGVLVPSGDAKAMAEAIVALLTNGALRKCLGENAAQDARERFDLKRQVEAYLGWYEELIGR